MKHHAYPKILLFTLLAVATTAAFGQGQKEKAYTEDWNSLSGHDETLEWFKDTKFGIYFHWGVYSVPAFGDE